MRARAQGIFRRTQLKAMLDIHGVEEGLGGDLTADEIGIIRGALDLSHKTAATCMTPFDKARCSRSPCLQVGVAIPWQARYVWCP